MTKTGREKANGQTKGKDPGRQMKLLTEKEQKQRKKLGKSLNPRPCCRGAADLMSHHAALWRQSASRPGAVKCK